MPHLFSREQKERLTLALLIKLSFSKGWCALNFVSMCIRNVPEIEILHSSDTGHDFQIHL